MTKQIEFISYDKSAEIHYPPVPVSKFIPDWYKDLPKDISHEDLTVPSSKRCMPLQDYLTGGYVIRNSYETDIKFAPDEDGILRASNICPAKDYVSGHPFQQAPVMQNGVRKHYFKIGNSWLIKTPPGYSCHFYQPFYLFNEDFRMLPGIVDTDKHDDAVNFVGIGLKNHFVIKPGDPLVVVYPFKRDDWKMDVSYDNYQNKNKYRYYVKKAWHGTYSRLFHSRKKFR
jgi:hypothetical protein